MPPTMRTEYVEFRARQDRPRFLSTLFAPVLAGSAFCMSCGSQLVPVPKELENISDPKQWI